MPILILGICLVQLLVTDLTAVRAFEPPPAYRPHDPPRIAPALADVYDLLYFGKSRPYWIRMHVRSAGRPFARAFERWLDALFYDLDVNGDGYLDAEECRRIPPNPTVTQMMLNGYPIFGGFPSPSLNQLDENHDGKVSRSELAEYYLRGPLPFVRILPAYSPDPYAATLNQTIFELLDANQDDRISRDEMRTAEKLLDRLDLNDDECLSALELAPALFSQQQSIPFSVPGASQFLFTRPDLPPRDLARQLLQCYDRDKDFHLTRKEIGLDDTAFAALDRDGNGKLDVPELADYFAHGLPDLVLVVSFADGANVGVIDRVHSWRTGVSVASIRPGTWDVHLGELHIRLDRPYSTLLSPQRGQPRNSYRQQITGAFMQAAAGKSHVAESDLDSPSGRQLRGLFPYADRNRDRKLTMPELNAFFDLDFRVSDVTLNLSLFSTSRNWFVELDINHDGRLSRKELQNAWETLTGGREPPGGMLSRPSGDDRLNLIFHRGPTLYPNVNQAYLNPSLPPPPTRGPLWFRKMDRNRDGYVSRREFLGTKAEFDRLDRNGDGLIDVEEAEAAEKK
jgi:Ca2+-binding EF-hand superfamily protein